MALNCTMVYPVVFREGQIEKGVLTFIKLFSSSSFNETFNPLSMEYASSSGASQKI